MYCKAAACELFSSAMHSARQALNLRFNLPYFVSAPLARPFLAHFSQIHNISAFANTRECYVGNLAVTYWPFIKMLVNSGVLQNVVKLGGGVFSFNSLELNCFSPLLVSVQRGEAFWLV